MNNKGISIVEISIIIAIMVACISIMATYANGRVKSETGNSAILKDARYTEFYTDDGVRCIFYKRGYGGGLSCDFK